MDGIDWLVIYLFYLGKVEVSYVIRVFLSYFRGECRGFLVVIQINSWIRQINKNLYNNTIGQLASTTHYALDLLLTHCTAWYSTVAKILSEYY